VSAPPMSALDPEASAGDHGDALHNHRLYQKKKTVATHAAGIT